MEVPIQVAVQICPCYPNEPCCVQTIPQYIDDNANKLSIVPANGLISNTENNKNSGMVIVAAPTNVNFDANNVNDEQTSFAIKHALPFGCSQEFIYRQTVFPLIDSFLEGFDISIVTYGQHCTGKTYTMYGPGFDCVYGESEQGVVQRAVRDIFSQLTKRQCERRYSVNVAWVEICGNEIHDILGGRIVQCANIGDVFQCLQVGMANRSQEASHSLFTITLEQQWVTANGLIQHRLSTASFCDLCGTERMSSVNQFNQQVNVPKDIGLAALERIVSAVCDPNFVLLDNSNINLVNQYEETMLTNLLKDSFGGRAQTLFLLCVSPLEQDVFETIQNLQFAYKVQFVRNTVVMNTFSDNNLPISHFIDPMLIAAPQIPVPLPQALHYNPIPVATVEKTNAINNQNGLKFAASQWLKLVSNAEGLFNKLLTNNKTLNEQDRECIEEWLYLRQECEECLSSAELATNQRLLGPIQETDEPDENNSTSDGGGVNGANDNLEQLKNNGLSSQMTAKKERFDSQNESIINTTLTDNESDSDDIMQQTEYLEEKISDLMINFSCKTNSMIEENYDDFIKTYPKAVTHSLDGKTNKELPCARVKRSNSVIATTEAPTNAYSGRRRSNQAGGSGALMLSSADLVFLQQVADEGIRNSQSLSMNNSVCREATEFLESSNDMHPLRAANANKAQEELLNKIRRLRTDIDAKQTTIQESRHNICSMQQLINELKDSGRAKAKRRLTQKETTLMAEREKFKKLIVNSRDKKEIEKLQSDLVLLENKLDEVLRMREISSKSDNKRNEYEINVSNQKKELNALIKAMKKDSKKLEALERELSLKFKQEKSRDARDDKRLTAALTSNVDTRITQLDCVLKEKHEYLRINSNGESEQVESIRHEIRNLRSQRDRLTEAQCVLNQKLKKEKKLSDDEARQILEYDVAKEVIDHAMELKNQLICGRDVSNKNHMFVGNPDLMNQLSKLNEKEMRILLYKCFQKIVDLRDSSRQLEIQLIQLEHERTEWELRERALSNQFQQCRLEEERNVLHLQRQYEATLTKLLQKVGDDSSSSTMTSSSSSSMLMEPVRSNILQLLPKLQSSHRHHQQYFNLPAGIFENRSTSKKDTSINSHGHHHSHQHHQSGRHTYRHNEPDLMAVDHKQKPKNLLSKLLRHRNYLNVTNQSGGPSGNLHQLMLANHHQSNSATEGRVSVVNKKIIIQQKQ